MRVNKIFLLFFLFSAVNCWAGEEKFGIFTSQNGVSCVSFGGPPPPIGSSISIIETQSSQYFFKGVLEGEIGSCKAQEKADIAGPYFSVKTERKTTEPFIGIAVFSKNVASLVNDEVVLNADLSKAAIYFRSCTSSEGLHFSSWLGKPLKGKRLWRLDFYLGYDLEPSCQEGDFKD